MTTAVPPTQVARTVGILAKFQNLAPGGFGLQQRIAVFGRGATASTFSTTKAQMFSAQEAGETYGFGSPIHIMVSQLLPVSGDGVGNIPVTVYPLPDGSAASAGDITPSGPTTAAGTIVVRISNFVTASITLASGTSVADICTAIAAAVNANVNMPMTAAATATDVDLTAKWQGANGDTLVVSVEGDDLGITFPITQPTAGAGAPIAAEWQTALGQVGQVWETIIVQSIGNDTVALDELSAWNEGRWEPSESRPVIGAFYGETESSVATAITVPDARTTDRTNSQLVSPGATDLEMMVAARQVARIAKIANSTSPGRDYARQLATGLTPGADGDQWTSSQRDTAVKGGSSTVEVEGGVVALSDTVTMYHPVGDPTPAYRYVVDNNKLVNMLSDLRATFDSADWAGAELIPDNQATTSPTAKKPRMARAAVAGLVDSWALRALISDPDTAKATIVAAIDSMNPKRLNISLTVQLSGNTNVISVDLNFGFFFGTPVIAA